MMWTIKKLALWIRERIPTQNAIQARRIAQEQEQKCQKRIGEALSRQRTAYIIELQERMDPLIEKHIKLSVQSEVAEDQFTYSIRVDRHMLEMMQMSSDSGRQVIRDYVADRLYTGTLKAYQREIRVKEAF